MDVVKALLRLGLGVGLIGFVAPLLATPTIQTWTLKNGVNVYFVESHELPMVQIKLAFDAGSARDPEGEEGLGIFLAGRMLDEGTASRDADAIAKAFEQRGAEFSVVADRDMAALNLRSLSESQYLEPALEVLRDIVMHPSFPKENLERERQRTLIGLKRAEQSPGHVVRKAFFRLLYGDHPYASLPAGDEVSVKTFTREALVAHHKRYYVGSNAILAVVGDLSLVQAKRLAATLAGHLPKGQPAPPLPAPLVKKKGITKHISFPSTQTHIYTGLLGMSRKEPDYFPLYVGNYILGGGGLVSRLAETIREKEGLAYSVYSYFWPMRLKGPFILGLQTKNTQRDKALELARKTLAQFVDKGPTEDELKAAKKHLTGGFPLRIDSNKKIAEYLTIIGFYELPLTYLDEFNTRVESVTVDQIHNAFRRLPFDKQVTVTVGGDT